MSTTELPSRRFLSLLHPHRDMLYARALSISANRAAAESALQRGMRQAFRVYAQNRQGPDTCVWLAGFLGAGGEAIPENGRPRLAMSEPGTLDLSGKPGAPSSPRLVAGTDSGEPTAAPDAPTVLTAQAAGADALSIAAMPADAWARLAATVQIEAAKLAGAGSDEALLAYDPDLAVKKQQPVADDLPDGLNWSPFSRFVLAAMIVLIIGIAVTIILTTRRREGILPATTRPATATTRPSEIGAAPGWRARRAGSSGHRALDARPREKTINKVVPHGG